MKTGGYCWFGCDFIGDFKKAIKKMKEKKNARKRMQKKRS